MRRPIGFVLALVTLASARLARADAAPPAPTAAASVPVPAPVPSATPTPEAPVPEEPPSRVNWPGGHVGYAPGGSYFNGAGFREALDLAVDFLHGLDCRSKDVRVLACSGWMVSGSLVTGFSASPTYLTLDGGYGVASLIGWHVLAGPAVRLGPEAGVGFDLQAILYLFAFEVGPRLIVIPSGSRQAQLTFLLGLGFN